MKTKIKIKSYLGKLLFEFEKENNTVKDTVNEAIKTGAYLSALISRALISGALMTIKLKSKKPLFLPGFTNTL
jgi:hypothetical protein